MLPEVDQAILDTIRQNLSTLPKSSVVLHRSDDPPKKMPAVYLWNAEFTSSDMTIGAYAGKEGKIVEDAFDGDGKRVEFKLSTLPLRPSVTIASPLGREGRDYTVNYSTGMVKFNIPPEKGRKNVLVSYSSGKDSAEVRGLRLKLDYNLDVWSSEAEEGSILANQVASIILKTRDDLASKGISLRLSGGRDLTAAKDGIPSGVYCRRLDCIAEAEMLVKLPTPRIDRIEMKQRDNLK